MVETTDDVNVLFRARSTLKLASLLELSNQVTFIEVELSAAAAIPLGAVGIPIVTLIVFEYKELPAALEHITLKK